MTLLRGLVAVILTLSGSGLAAGQVIPTSPLIVIQPTAPKVAQPAPQASATTPATPVAPQGEQPKIVIAPLGPSVTSPDQPPVAAAPVNRDAGQQPVESATVADWLLPLVPFARLVPTEVGIGGSMPQPGQFRLTGETASADFLLTLPDGVSAPTELQLSLRSSVNVLPATSKMTISVNDIETGAIGLNNFTGFAEQRLPISGLKPGANRIRLSVVQAHRIYCGPDASFAIWTEVQLGRSGVTIKSASLPVSPQGFIVALQYQVANGGSIEILDDGKTSGLMLQDVAHRIIDALGGAAPIAVRNYYRVQSGPAAKARIVLIPAAQPKVSFRRGAMGAIVLQIEYSGDKLPDMSPLLPVPPLPASLPALTPGRTTTLAELGQALIVGNTHYFRQDVNFLLPFDWLLLANEKAELTLHYGYSADLAAGTLLLVKINGQTIHLLTLDHDGGKVMPPLKVTFPANLLNPEANALTFEMSVPGDPADLPCTRRKTDMLAVLGDSSMTIPPSPSMQQADILRSLTRLGGDGLVFPTEVADPLKADSALLAFGALFNRLEQAGKPARLHVVGIDDVGLVPRGTTDVTRRMLLAAVYPVVATKVQDAVVAAIPTPQPATVPGFSLADGNDLPAQSGGVPAADPAKDAPQHTPTASARDWVVGQIGGLRNMMSPGSTSLATWLQGQSGLALLLQLDPAAPDDVWLIAGPNIAMSDLAVQVDRFRRNSGAGLHGQAAILLQDDTWVTWSQNRRPELLEPLTLSNVQQVLGNFASWSPALFTVLTLAFALLSIIPALVFVLITRRPGTRT